MKIRPQMQVARPREATNDSQGKAGDTLAVEGRQ
jgi:hypothetical protein